LSNSPLAKGVGGLADIQYLMKNSIPLPPFQKGKRFDQHYCCFLQNSYIELTLI
jgi:hypothetical protein